VATILIVEDDRSLREALAYNLQREDHAVALAEDVPSALRLARQRNPDLILLDLMLPGGSGFDVCREIRSFSTAPIIMVTARDDDVDRIVGLEIGADDYVTKPFSLRELMARVKANLRRVQLDRSGTEDDVVRQGELTADLAARRVTLGQDDIEFQPKEFDLLVFLMRHAGTVLTRERLLRGVWGHEFVGPRTVDVHVRRVRAKLEGTPYAEVIRTIHGVGYVFQLAAQ
jgi:two-component system response regulator VicR